MKKLYSSNHFNFIVTLLLAVLFLLSCDDRTIDPFEDQQGVYSIYGALEVGSAQNYVRVRKLDTALLADSAAFDGTVTFTDLETGTSSVLRDSIVEFNGNFTHNFLVEHPINYNQEYLIQVESEEGDLTESVASTPGITTLDLQPNPFDPNTEIRCNDLISFRFINVIRPELIRMDIGFRHNGRMNWSTLDLVDQLEYSSDADEMRVALSPRDMLIEVFTPPLPDNPFLDPRTLMPTVSCSQLHTKSVFIRYYHFGKEWDEALPFRTGNIDIESDVVKNGLGFFGGYSTSSFVIPFQF